MVKKMMKTLSLTVFLVFLSACSSFTGIRTPKYDGQPFEVQPEKIAAYAESREIIGEETEYYVPETFSADILAPALEYTDHEPVLLEEGSYVIGEDFPSGRVNIIGEKENPDVVIMDFNDPLAPDDPENYRVGTMTIRDEEGKLYFENMFHPYYGVMITQVDFIEGHTIDIVGSNPEIVVFYDEELPQDPYVFDTRWEDYLAELEEQEGFEGFVEVEEGEEPGYEGIEDFQQEQEQALNEIGEENAVELKAGIYEVGKHLEPGLYEITEESAPTYTELFIFRSQEEPRVIDISHNLYGLFHGWQILNPSDPEEQKPVIELVAGDKIFPHYVNRLKLTKMD